MSNESMANYITDVTSAIAELLALNKQLEQELQKTREQLDIAEAVLSVQVTDSALAYFKDKQGE